MNPNQQLELDDNPGLGLDPNLDPDLNAATEQTDFENTYRQLQQDFPELNLPDLPDDAQLQLLCENGTMAELGDLIAELLLICENHSKNTALFSEADITWLAEDLKALKKKLLEVELVPNTVLDLALVNKQIEQLASTIKQKRIVLHNLGANKKGDRRAEILYASDLEEVRNLELQLSTLENERSNTILAEQRRLETEIVSSQELVARITTLPSDAILLKDKILRTLKGNRSESETVQARRRVTNSKLKLRIDPSFLTTRTSVHTTKPKPRNNGHRAVSSNLPARRATQPDRQISTPNRTGSHFTKIAIAVVLFTSLASAYAIMQSKKSANSKVNIARKAFSRTDVVASLPEAHHVRTELERLSDPTSVQTSLRPGPELQLQLQKLQETITFLAVNNASGGSVTNWPELRAELHTLHRLAEQLDDKSVLEQIRQLVAQFEIQQAVDTGQFSQDNHQFTSALQTRARYFYQLYPVKNPIPNKAYLSGNINEIDELARKHGLEFFTPENDQVSVSNTPNQPSKTNQPDPGCEPLGNFNGRACLVVPDNNKLLLIPVPLKEGQDSVHFICTDKNGVHHIVEVDPNMPVIDKARAPMPNHMFGVWPQ